MRTLPILFLLGCQGRGSDTPSDTGTTARPPPTGGVTTPDVVAPCVVPRVVINEVVSSNVEGVVDEDGDTPDWIELYNAEPVAVDLAGWWLRDGGNLWELPTVDLGPGEHQLVFASGKDRGAGVRAWHTKVDQGDTWRYREIEGPFEPDWFTVGYDDSAWATGPSGFGRGDDDDQTRIESHRAQVRTTFAVSPDELADVAVALLHVDFDDGFVAWLNGVEVARANLPGQEDPAWDAFTESPHEADLYQGNPPSRFEIDPALLREQNTLALTVANFSETSTDLSLIPFLTLGYHTERAGSPTTAFDVATGALHTSFALSAQGEAIALLDPHGCSADVVDMAHQWTDVSYGRAVDGGEAFGYFMAPTPGAPNVTESRPGFAESPVFTPGSGFYPGGASVSVSAGADARIVVATGGVEPQEVDPDHTGAIPIDGSSQAEVLRARAFEEGLWPSRITTATYFGREAGPVSVISVVTDPPNLWDWDTGIYAMGDGADPEPPHQGANFWQDWEKPGHVTMWEPDGTVAFDVDGALEIFGGNSRGRPQKSLKLKMRGGYGEPVIRHRVFPELDVEEFDSLVFRNSGSDWLGCTEWRCYYGSMFRDAMMQRMTEGVDLDTMAYRPAVLYLNGEYWGIQNVRERAQTSWIVAHHGLQLGEFDLIERRGPVLAGDDVHYQQLMQYLRDNDLSDPAVYDTLQTLMDVDQFANYQAIEIWFDNKDWPGNNIRYWRPRTPDGRWRWLVYDLDFGVGLWGDPPDLDKLEIALAPDSPGWPNPPESTELFRLMMSAPQFQTTFVNRYADLMNTLFLPSRTQAILAEMAAEVAPVIPDHLARWGTDTNGKTVRQVTLGDWQDALDHQHDWLAERTPWARAHLIDHLGLAGTWTLDLQTDPPGAGTFELTAVTVEAPFTGTYFLGVPVTVTAIPASGYAFAGWSDGDLPQTASITLDPSGATALTARFE